MNLLAILISIIIHVLIVASVYYANSEKESGNKITKAVGVNTVIGTKMNIKMIVADIPTPLPPKPTPQRKVTAEKNTAKSTATSKPSALMTKAKMAIGFTKKEISNTPAEKKMTKSSAKTEKSVQDTRLVLKKSEIVKTIKKKSSKKKLKEKTILAQKGVRHTGDNVNKSQINMGNSNDDNTPWNQYKSAVFSAINAQKIYPKQAKLRRAEGTVVVKFNITKLGNISRFTLIKKVGSEHLNRSTIRLFDQLYLPGRPESVIEHLPATLTVPIEYSLN